MIELTTLNRNEAKRYLGGAKIELDERMSELFDSCEKQVLSTAKPKFLYKIIDLPNEKLTAGEDIKSHLNGCTKAVLICATLGAEVDRMIRVSQISDMPRAVVLDSFSSVAVEQLCQSVDALLAEKYPEYYFTFRYSPGYGDYPIELQKEFLSLLDAPRKIGLSANENYLLIPSKSVTAIAGMSHNPIERKKRGCAVCDMRDRCKYRRNGEHCGF